MADLFDIAASKMPPMRASQVRTDAAGPVLQPVADANSARALSGARALLARLGLHRGTIALRHVPSGRSRRVEIQEVGADDLGWRVPIVIRDTAAPDDRIAWLAFADGESAYITLADCEDAVTSVAVIAFDMPAAPGKGN